MNIKGAGRKPMESENRREKNMRVRLTDAELLQIQELYRRTRKQTISDMVRTVIFQEKLLVRIENREFQAAMQDISSLIDQSGKIIRSKAPKFDDFKEIVERLEISLKDASAKFGNQALTLSDLKEVNISDK
ncbi:hypothetical protein [Dyadobacter psychrotolerans]|uniref:Uncharacterized protein n=1 Tax=Dyadobacter psychrotolerans TaxID=2541721 RepID=A0A4R5DDP7_9BACT|nr:hypothetical protein [Dyadobacter psychrotolerans]TDE08695.1 hypothetical protein E0F88_32205 [Dyadobacter psychrotolerans]